MGLARLIHDLHPAASAPFIQRQTVRDPKKSGTRPARKIIFTQKVAGFEQFRVSSFVLLHRGIHSEFFSTQRMLISHVMKEVYYCEQ